MTDTRIDIAELLRLCVSQRHLPSWSDMQAAYEEIERLRAIRAATVPPEQVAREIATHLGEEFDALPPGPHFEPEFTQDDFVRAADAVLALIGTPRCSPVNRPAHVGMSGYLNKDDYIADLVNENDNVFAMNEKLRDALKRLLASINPGNADEHEPGCRCVIHEARAALTSGERPHG